MPIPNIQGIVMTNEYSFFPLSISIDTDPGKETYKSLPTLLN